MASFISQFNVVSKLAPIYVSLVLSIVPIHLMVPYIGGLLLEMTQFLHVVEQPCSHLELVQQLEADDCSDVGPVCSWTAYPTD